MDTHNSSDMGTAIAKMSWYGFFCTANLKPKKITDIIAIAMCMGNGNGKIVGFSASEICARLVSIFVKFILSPILRPFMVFYTKADIYKIAKVCTLQYNTNSREIQL